MEEIIIFSPKVIDKLESPVYILFDKCYFGYVASSEVYVNRIYDFIDTIPLPLRKTKHPKYGKCYARYFVKNKRTQYYITFDTKGDGRYFIQNIFTSHESGYDTYIKGVK